MAPLIWQECGGMMQAQMNEHEVAQRPGTTRSPFVKQDGLHL
jgi:hypothetical protein